MGKVKPHQLFIRPKTLRVDKRPKQINLPWTNGLSGLLFFFFITLLTLPTSATPSAATGWKGFLNAVVSDSPLTM